MVKPETVRIIEMNLLNALKADDGQYDNLKCPDCDQESVSVYYSRVVEPGRERFGIWLVCAACGETSHIDRTTQPKGFHLDRIRWDLQKLEERAVTAERAQASS